ncbi:UDP-N-acetyl-alpha-D-glucosamine C6 dehydratase [Dyadobacter sp. CECT 9623]|uniref:UDP-N-acetyl-alpha-D-glucosamine C6 dehydratase n=1 Tax=Dyadobacter linearis TaxID=2823330 RepID=A0ABM8UUA1_9BACT|nr:SDR family NAD(P)-dependent oxidoreductase [Dyadobacter sp. CECT 9623]CAG5071859.1 UDP-N-acetyl-alpha-D-glucosamine C6 dehydratase [Dyadobacter sp. CECT 9623]
MKSPVSKKCIDSKSAFAIFLKNLSREPICTDHQNSTSQIADKKVLITGAAGSIGSELATQLCAASPALLVLIDQSETALFELETTIRNAFPDIRIELYVADITDLNRMERIISAMRPHIIFHAAAYKHVAVMQKHPYEALKVNFFGTKILADLAVKYAVSCFLLVSTDKAVRPASVMGATKRLAELYIQHIHPTSHSTTRFITTRFGNVLGSSGSFTNILQSQIEKGGPVTITHPFATRYFMTSAEACQLVLHAFATGENGNIMFFDMGDRISIVSIAEQMVSAYGLLPHRDIEMIFTGLRPGEKLHEDLLNDNETVKPGSHSKTRIAVSEQVPAAAFEEVTSLLEDLMHRGTDSQISAALRYVFVYLSGQANAVNSILKHSPVRS